MQITGAFLAEVLADRSRVAVEAVAEILPKSANAATYDAIGKRYGLLGKTFNLFSKWRGGMQNNVSLLLKPVN